MSRWTKTKFRKSIVLCILATLLICQPVNALKDTNLDKWSSNDIFFYDPDECSKEGSSSKKKNNSESAESGVTSSSGGYDRLKEAVGTYYQAAMEMQEEYGTPWDVVFAQMQIESQVGTAGVAVSGADNNWLGITGEGDAGSIQIANNASTVHTWAKYSSVDVSIKAWGGPKVLRNGYYDDAFPYLNPNNWDMHSFLQKMISHYAPSSDGNDEDQYVSNIESLLYGPIKEKTEELGLMNSEEYAIAKNIPVGGKNPLDSVITDDVSTGGSSSSTDTSGSTVNCPEEAATIDGKVIAEKAVQLAWPVQENGTCVDGSGNEVDWDSSKESCYHNPRDAYQEAYDRYQMEGNLDDCGHFVSTVVHAAEVDSDYPKSGSANMGPHMDSSSKWEKVSASSESDLKPGDILWYSGSGASGHIEIYVGSYGGKYGTVASASMDMYVGIIKGLRANMERQGEKATVYRLVPQTGGLKEGGMTLEEAKAFMESYAAESDKKLKGNYTFDGALVTDGGCPDGTLNNCSAFTQWFLNKYTTLGPSGANRYQGSEAVHNYLADHPELQDGGKTPKAYAIMSEGPSPLYGYNTNSGAGGSNYYNHTGIVLGINTEANTIIIGEASCGANSGGRRFRPQAKEYPLSEYTDVSEGAGPKYAYTDSILVGLTPSGGSESGDGTTPIEPITASSTDISCASGTTDLGIEEEAYTGGVKTPIRLCSIPNITSTASTDTDGHIHVNSRVSGAYYALGKQYQDETGTQLSASQSFRTMEDQQYFWGCYQSKTCNNGYTAARPGYSNHQLGLAVDFNVGGWDSAVSNFFYSNLPTYGLNRAVNNEPWHVSPTGH